MSKRKENIEPIGLIAAIYEEILDRAVSILKADPDLVVVKAADEIAQQEEYKDTDQSKVHAAFRLFMEAVHTSDLDPTKEARSLLDDIAKGATN